MNKIATVLLFVNFITVLFPQPGYIHPDEFLQSSEVVAGDVLGVSHIRAWEFNSSFPVRSILFPYMVTSPSLYLLRWLNSTNMHGLQLSTVKVVMATRLPTAFLSVFGFLATDRLAKAFLTDSYLSCVLYCSSYVVWTYYTRTFSNSIESVLLAVVLILSLPYSISPVSFHRIQEEDDAQDKEDEDGKEIDSEEDEEKEVKENEKGNDSISDDVNEKEEQTVTKSEDSKQDRLVKKSKVNPDSTERIETEGDDSEKCKETDMSREETHEKIIRSLKTNKSIMSTDNFVDIKNYPVKFTSFALGVVIVAGFFNRPTFLVFAFMPVVFWLWNVWCNCGKENWGSIFFTLFFSMSLGAFLSFSIFVFVDTMYYNPQFLADLSASFHTIIEKNFSLETLMENVEAILSSIVVTPWNFLQYNIDTSNLAQHGLHPRFTHFLINLPLLLGPLCLPFMIVGVISVVRMLGGSNNNRTVWLTFMAFVPIACLSVFPHQEPRFLIPLLPILVVMGTQIIAVMAAGKMSFFSMWALFNIILTLAYGYMHQAALIPALSIYQQKLTSLPVSPDKSHHAVFYKTYPPPRHLLLQDPERTHITVTDLAGSPLDTLLETVKEIRSSCRTTHRKCDTYIFMPSTVTNKALDQMSQYQISITSICPHLSMEAPPRFMSWWKKRISFDNFITDFCLNIFKIT